MKSPVLLASAVSILALSACATAPSDRSVTLRRGKILVTENTPAPVAPVVVETPAPVVVVTPAVTAPEPVAPVVVTPPPVAEPAPVVATPPPAPVVPPAPVAVTPTFQAVRTGALVNLSWTLPESVSGYRAIEIMRNTQAQPAGRGRVRAVRATVTSIEDILPDASANYWYWIKLTHVDGTVQNLGPFATESKS